MKNYLLQTIHLKSLFSVILLSLLFYSCDSKIESIEPTRESTNATFNGANTPPLITDITSINNYFTEDSISYFTDINKTPSLKGIVTGSFWNNLGMGVNSATNEFKISIFKPNQPIKEIVKHTLNEFFTYKIVASWDSQKNDHVIDSIIAVTQGMSSNMSKLSLNKTTISRNTIYINIFQVNRFGNAYLDIDNPLTDKFLSYKSSKYHNQEVDSILLPAETFKQLYGDKYISNLTLGTLFSCQVKIEHITFFEGKENEILVEASEIMKQVINENKDWDALLTNSQYFKSAINTSISVTGIPRNSICWSIKNIVSELKNNETLYKSWDFGILDKQYDSYSNIYPKYNFSK